MVHREATTASPYQEDPGEYQPFLGSGEGSTGSTSPPLHCNGVSLITTDSLKRTM